MAVELTLKLTIENGGVGQPNVNGDIIEPLTVEDMKERGFFVDPTGCGFDNYVSLDEFFLTRDPEDDSFFVIQYTDAKDVI